MTTSLETLVKILPPPTHPKYNHGDWGLVQNDLEVQVPKDFKQFIEIYGSGWISSMIGIINPFDLPADNSWNRISRDITTIYQAMDCPYPPFPESGCLLPFASTDNGDYINWVVQGPPDDWRVVYWDFPGEEENILRTELGFVDFLAHLLLDKPPLFWQIFDRECFEKLEYGSKK